MKKRQQRSTRRKVTNKPQKAARRPAEKSAAKAGNLPVRVTATGAFKQAAAAARPAPQLVGLSIAQQAEHLRDEILRSKLTHPNPWGYAPKARAWTERVQVLVEQIDTKGDTPGARRSLEALDAELRRDRDFQEARRLF